MIEYPNGRFDEIDNISSVLPKFTELVKKGIPVTALHTGTPGELRDKEKNKHCIADLQSLKTGWRL